MNDNHARLSPALVETIAGLTAGAAATLAAHPLDVIKTRLQSQFPTELSLIHWMY
jgi:solute carrier family 25 (mitochondrial folate transporter), member 32